MIKDNIAEWTGEASARSHKPLDAGSIPASAIRAVDLPVCLNGLAAHFL